MYDSHIDIHIDQFSPRYEQSFWVIQICHTSHAQSVFLHEGKKTCLTEPNPNKFVNV